MTKDELFALMQKHGIRSKYSTGILGHMIDVFDLEKPELGRATEWQIQDSIEEHGIYAETRAGLDAYITELLQRINGGDHA